MPEWSLKTHSGLEPIPRWEPSAYQRISWWLSQCAIEARVDTIMIQCIYLLTPQRGVTGHTGTHGTSPHSGTPPNCTNITHSGPATNRFNELPCTSVTLFTNTLNKRHRCESENQECVMDVCETCHNVLNGVRRSFMVKGRKEMFYLTMHSTHFIYGYMVTSIW